MLLGDTGCMAPTAGDQLQLGQHDVPAHVLSAEGVPLADLVGAQGVASVDTLLGPPPRVGWRVISGSLPPPPGELVMLAAPWTGPPWGRASNGWMQVSFTYRNGQWSACINDDVIPVRPGRAHRRVGLRLDWAEASTSGRTGTRPELRLHLRNTSEHTWIGDGIDDDHVSVWLVGPDGERLRRDRGRWGFEAMPCHRLTSIEPGDQIALPGFWQTDVESFPTGHYVMQGELTALLLRSAPGKLLLR